MSFFKKLKDRLFKSSSKLDEGLEAIVEDGGELSEADVTEAQADEARRAAEAEARAAAEVARLEQERAAQEAEEARQAESAAREEQERLAREAQERAAAEAARVAAEAAEAEAQAAREQAEAEAARQAQEEAERHAAEEAAQQARQTAEAEAQHAAEVQRLEQEKREEAARQEAERRAEADRQAEAAQQEAEQRAAQAEAARREAEEAERARQEAARQEAEHAERALQEAERAEAARLAQEREAEEARAAEQARLEEERRLSEAAPASDVASNEDAATKKPGLLGRLFGRREKQAVLRRELDDDMLERLEELLISADMGVDTALRVTANMAEGRFGKKLSVREIKELLAEEVARIMDPVARPMPLFPKTPQVVLVVGVNGSGKTTTIGKLASQFRAAGKKVVIAAGDTFRAAAVEQLQVWGERAGVPVLTAPEGSDPASLAFDAMAQAQRDGADLLMIDTAGRLQNRADLMEELAKIVRVIRKQDETAPHNTLLVLDATTGQNALSQVKIFQEVSDVSGLVMTKLDGTAKGGVLVALADKFGLPIHAIGVGEQIDDLAPFDPEEFAAALTGLESDEAA